MARAAGRIPSVAARPAPTGIERARGGNAPGAVGRCLGNFAGSTLPRERPTGTIRATAISDLRPLVPPASDDITDFARRVGWLAALDVAV